VKLLLDTHTFIWLATAPEKLSSAALEACSDLDNDLYLSVVTPWEIQIKTQLGKLSLPASLEHMIARQVKENGLTIMPVTLSHVYALDGLAQHHRDPFDRLLIAQAMVENMTVVSRDGWFGAYSVSVIW